MRSKKEFLGRLQQLLLWKYSKDEIIDILNDFNEYFDVGISKGNSEEEICSQLGSPILIVKNLEIENSKKGPILFIIKKIILFICALSGAMFLLSRINLGRNILVNLLVFLPVFTLLIWLILGGRLFSMDWINKNHADIPLKKIIILHSIDFVIATFVIVLTQFLILYWMNHIPFGLNVSQLGPFVVNILYFIILILLCMTMYALYNFRKKSTIYFSSIIHSVGMIVTILGYLNVMHSLMDPALIHTMTLISEILYLETIIMVLLFLFKMKMEKNIWMRN